MNRPEPIHAWWFSDFSCRLQYMDNRKAELGVTHSVPGRPRVCSHGLHGSRDILAALEYAPGPVVWRVILLGEISDGGDRIAAHRRQYIAGGIDIENDLSCFARLCALDVIDLWDAPAAVIEWLHSDGEAHIRAAAVTALEGFSGLLSAPEQVGAAWSAYEATRPQPFLAAINAARRARTAHRYANDGAGARAAYWDTQNARLTHMVTMAIREAEA